MIRRNVASQTILFPQLALTADGTAVTSSAAISVVLDGASPASGGGTLAHVSGGVWKYTPTQAETNCAILGLVLTATSAMPVVLNLVTTAADTSANALGANTVTPLDAPGIRAAIGLNSDNLDTQLTGLPEGIWGYATRTLSAISDSSGVTTLLSRINSALTISSGKVTVGLNEDKTGYALATPPLDASGVRDAVGLSVANLDDQIDAVKQDTGNSLSLIGTVNNTTAETKTNTETLLSRITSGVFTLFTDLIAMITGSGVSAAFTAVAMQNAAIESEGGDANVDIIRRGPFTAGELATVTIESRDEDYDFTDADYTVTVIDRTNTVIATIPNGSLIKTVWAGDTPSTLRFSYALGSEFPGGSNGVFIVASSEDVHRVLFAVNSVNMNVVAWRGTQPEVLDGNGFVPSNTAAINGNTNRVDVFATAMDNDRLDAKISTRLAASGHGLATESAAVNNKTEILGAIENTGTVVPVFHGYVNAGDTIIGQFDAITGVDLEECSMEAFYNGSTAIVPISEDVTEETYEYEFTLSGGFGPGVVRGILRNELNVIVAIHEWEIPDSNTGEGDFSIVFRVRNATDESIAGAKVSIYDGDTLVKALTTRVDGTATYNLDAGDYTFNATASGFDAVSGQELEVTEADAVEIEMEISDDAGSTPEVVTVNAGADFSKTITMTMPENWQSVIFTAKNSAADADAESLIQIRKTNGGNVNDGIIYLLGNTAVSDKAKGSVAVSGNSIIINVTADITTRFNAVADRFRTRAQLTSGSVWHIQVVTATGAVPYLIGNGEFKINRLATIATT